jgi:hypothetical protein
MAGTWRLTKTSGKVSGQGSQLAFAGGQGTTLRVAKGVATYDFTRSARMTENGKKGKALFGLWLKYDKVLRMKSGYTGNGKGTVGLQAKTASGPATLNGQIVRPRPFPLKKQLLAPLVKKGQTDQALLPLGGSDYVCTAKTLHLHHVKKDKHGYTTVADWWFKRIRR